MARAKYFSPLHLSLLPRRQIAAPAAANHQYVRKPLRIPNHPFVGAKYFSPKCRPLVARNRLSVSAAHHFWHGRNIFRPYFRHRWRLTISTLHHFWRGRNIFRPYARNWYATSNAIFQISAHVYGLGDWQAHKIFHLATIANRSTHNIWHINN